jgi:Cu/Ag efflux pump CusA
MPSRAKAIAFSKCKNLPDWVQSGNLFMISSFIKWALQNRMVVLLIAAAVTVYGIFSVKNTKVDAIPDLSENQVIIFSEWMGRSPQIMEDQVTYPLVSNLQGIPRIKTIRANSMFGMSFVFVIFEDDVDIYWARTRVLERLNYAQRLLPQGVVPTSTGTPLTLPATIWAS